MTVEPDTRELAVVVGNGGHGCVLADALLASDQYKIAGFVAPEEKGPVASLGLPWLGVEENFLRDPASALNNKSACIFVGIGDNFVRQKVQSIYAAIDFDFRFPALVHPAAYVALDVTLSDGCFVAAGAVIGVSARVEVGALVNVNAVADHHSTVGAFASLAQNCAMGGGASIGERSALGIGACLFHGTSIGSDSVVEGGSVVNADVKDNEICSGIPARSTGSRSPGDRYL